MPGDTLPPGYAGVETVKCIKQLPTGNIPENYFFYGDAADNGVISFSITGNTLVAKTYSSDRNAAGQAGATLAARYKNVVSAIGNNSDYCRITITSYHNGVVSGTFEAQLSNNVQLGVYPAPLIAKITEGEFRDIPVKY